MQACALAGRLGCAKTRGIGTASGPARYTGDILMSRTSIFSGLGLAVAVAAAAFTGTAHAGYSTVEQCTAVSGTITYSPALQNTAKPVTAVVNATISGCSGQNGAQAGTGSFNATLSAPAASRTANNESGTFVVNWPVASGLNPTPGTLALFAPQPGALYNLSGQDRAGAYASGVLSSQFVITGETLGGKKHNKVLQQTFVNALPLAIRVNFG